MSPEEQNAFERATLDHDFDLEALDGWELHSPDDLSKDIEHLKQRLPQSVSPRLGVGRMAAAISLLLVGTAVTYFLMEGAQDPIALQQPVKEDAIPLRSQESSEEQSVATEEHAVAETERPVSQPAPPGDENEPTPSDITFSMDEEVAEVDDNVSRDGLGIAAKATGDLEQAVEEIEITEEVLLEEAIAFNEEVPEEITRNSESTIAAADTDLTRKKVAEEISSSAPAAATTGIARTRTEAFSLSESVSAQPIAGYDAYREYLHAAAEEASKGDGVQPGVVTIRATVNADSTLSDLRVLNGLNEVTNEKALEIVNQGGLWIPASSGDGNSSSPVEIIVEFP